MSAVAAAIRDLCVALAPAHLELLAKRAENLSTWSAIAEKRLAYALPVPHRPKLDALTAAWQLDSSLPGSAIALGMRTAAAVADDPAAVSVEVVCTGPKSASTPVRLTSEVVCQLIDLAVDRVLVVSYAAYNVPRVIEALDAAVVRGVKVTLVLESPEKLNNATVGKYSKYPVHLWPIEGRPPNASLHAKVVAVDGRSALLTSANLTQVAYDDNIELGVLVRGGTAAADVEAHFAGLIRSGVLVPS